MKEKIIFLDIDSVLNHSSESETLYDLESKAFVEDQVPLCKSNILALKHIVRHVSNLSIVWSTDWRLIDSDVYGGWKNPLKWLENQEWIKNKIIGKTPKKMSSNRFEEIHFWFTQNEYAKRFNGKTWMIEKFHDISNYVIIDDFDSPGMQRYGKHFFKCNWRFGLTMTQAKDIVQFLSKDVFNQGELKWKNEQ